MDPARIAHIRREYGKPDLHLRDVAPDPLVQFERWFEAALAADELEPTAMTLATASTDGQPAARIVLLKGFSPEGFVFYTNYQSRKGEELAQNPKAALLFFWPVLERQVRIEGTVTQVDRAQAARYFESRPLASRLGAWASEQSAVLQNREELEKRYAEIAERYADGQVPLPDFWGGYAVHPTAFEFWQGRASRLHDRFRYERKEDGGWAVARLSP